MKKIYAGMFIIPNEISEFKYHHWQEDKRKRLQALGIEPNPDELMVQIWTSDNKEYLTLPETPIGLSDNWADHGVGLSEVDPNINPLLERHWPTFWPASLFEGKKEGDEIILTAGEIEFHLVLVQTQARHSDYGKFEEALQLLLDYAHENEAKRHAWYADKEFCK